MKLVVVALMMVASVVHAADFEVVGTYGERVDSFARYSHYVFLNQGFSLRVLDIADPARPKEIYWRYFAQHIDALALKYPALYVGFNEESLKIFDVSNPDRPAVCRLLDNGLRDKHLERAGDYLLYETWAGKECELWVYDIKDPLNPVRRIHVDLPGGKAQLGDLIFATNGSRLFLTEFPDRDGENQKIAVRDVTTSATTLGRIALEYDAATASIQNGKLVITGAEDSSITLLAVSKSDTIWQYKDGLSVLQPGRPAVPEKIALQDAPGGLRILENENGTTPTLRCVYGTDDEAEQFKLAGKRGYLMGENNKIELLDVSDPAHMRAIANPKLSGEIRAIDDNRVFVSGGKDAWFVYDFTDPTSPTLLSKFDCPDGSMSIQGARACIAAHNHGLEIFDISNPKAVRKTGGYPAEDAMDLATSGSLVYLIAGRLLVIDTSDPSKPIRVGETDIPFENSELNPESAQLKKLGPAVYVIEKGGYQHKHYSIRVVDVRDPAHPRVMPRQIDVDEPAEGESGSAPISNLTSAGSPYSGWYLAVPTYLQVQHGGWVYYGIPQITMLDLSDPLNPVEVFKTWSVQSSESSTPVLYKNTIYLPTGPGGLVVMRPTAN